MRTVASLTVAKQVATCYFALAVHLELDSRTIYMRANQLTMSKRFRHGF
jgi:hypothetical protein